MFLRNISSVLNHCTWRDDLLYRIMDCSCIFVIAFCILHQVGQQFQSLWTHFGNIKQVRLKKTILINYRIYSPISRLAYKSDTFFEANFEVFAIFSPISRYQFLPELVDNFRSMNSCLYWFQIKIFSKKTPKSIVHLTIKFKPLLLAFCWNIGMQYQYLTSKPFSQQTTCHC
jgi:hypothetical protein